MKKKMFVVTMLLLLSMMVSSVMALPSLTSQTPTEGTRQINLDVLLNESSNLTVSLYINSDHSTLGAVAFSRGNTTTHGILLFDLDDNTQYWYNFSGDNGAGLWYTGNFTATTEYSVFSLNDLLIIGLFNLIYLIAVVLFVVNEMMGNPSQEQIRALGGLLFKLVLVGIIVNVFVIFGGGF